MWWNGAKCIDQKVSQKLYENVKELNVITEKRLRIIYEGMFLAGHKLSADCYFYDKTCDKQKEYSLRYPSYCIKSVDGKILYAFKVLKKRSEERVDLPKDFVKAIQIAHMFEKAEKVY